MHRFILGGLIVLLGCGGPVNYPIESNQRAMPDYDQLLEEVNQRIEKDRSLDLIYKKLYYSHQLGWPQDVREDIRYLIMRQGLDYELYQYALDFYASSAWHEELLGLVDSWLRHHPASLQDYRWKVVALRGLGKEEEAKSFLWSLMENAEGSEDLMLAGKTYMDIGDTTRAMYAFARLAKVQPTEPVLMAHYVPLLLEQGYDDRVRELLIHQRDQVEGFKDQLNLAKALYQLGEPEEAIATLTAIDRPEAFLQLSDWYWSEKNWQEALTYADKLIAVDSSRLSLMRKAAILEDRGWLNDALSLYRIVETQHPQDSIAGTRAEQVERKIAYLRRLREEANRIPVLELKPKKTTENE